MSGGPSWEKSVKPSSTTIVEMFLNQQQLIDFTYRYNSIAPAWERDGVRGSSLSCSLPLPRWRGRTEGWRGEEMCLFSRSKETSSQGWGIDALLETRKKKKDYRPCGRRRTLKEGSRSRARSWAGVPAKKAICIAKRSGSKFDERNSLLGVRSDRLLLVGGKGVSGSYCAKEVFGCRGSPFRKGREPVLY